MVEQADRRRFPIGAELQSGQAHLRVWAPRCRRVAVVIDGSVRPDVALVAEGNGYFSGPAAGLVSGGRYRFRLDEQQTLYPDPASRFQPDGPSGPSEVIEPRAFEWTDRDWPGVSPRGQVIYELHIGTFTAEGTYAAAAERLPSLHELGVTMIEIMPLADAPGRFGWGYDGVNLWAPNRLYGRPDDLRRLVAGAHAVGIGVILDVVYNHIGPNENYLGCFSSDYFTARHKNEWGDAINFDGNNATPSREFFIENAGYWIEEFHLDGLRLDATQAMFDASDDHILAAIGRRVRAAAKGRGTYVVSENEPQETRLVRAPEGPPNEKGFGLDALWNDDFHHAAMVALTGHNEALHRLSGQTAGAVVGDPLGVSLPRATLQMAEAAARNTVPRSRCRAFRALSRESRPGRELRARRAALHPHRARSAPRDDGAAAAGAGDADAVPGTGVRIEAPVRLLRRPR